MNHADEPYALAETTEVNRRIELLGSPHIQPLIALFDSLRASQNDPDLVPWPDPCDGGTNARVLFLLEAPGGKAVGSGFISRNNPDPTARNTCELLKKAGIPRQQTLLWNVVPWYVGDEGKIRPVNSADIEAAKPHLKALLDHLKDLRAIVLVGRKAQQARGWIEVLSDVKIFESFHTSARVFNRWPEKKIEVEEVLRDVAAFIQD